MFYAAIRSRLVDSPVGDFLRLRRDLKDVRSWTSEDDSKMAFYSQFVKNGDLVFDIGANIGNRIKVFRRLGARVVALEPQPYCQGILKRVFGKDDKVTLLQYAVGEQEGTAEMHASTRHVLSSLSPEWLEAVNRSNRFGGVKWTRTVSCRVIPVKELVKTYGTPAFVKVDVEGYEPKVFAGMEGPVKAASFEFTPECLDAAFACIDKLNSLGMHEFSYSDGESMELIAAWDTIDRIKEILRTKTGTQAWGDVYARSVA